MKTILIAACALALTAPVAAQRTLADLQREFVIASRQLDRSAPSYEQQQELLKSQVAALERFLEEEAEGDDRWNGRLMLADLDLVLGRREAAVVALRTIDAEQAPPLVLITGATMAQHLGDAELRSAWIEAALAKDAPPADGMAIARLLMIVLHEPARAEALLEKCTRAAADDEGRAFVRWHRADMLRDREDLPENTGFEELEKLARDLPETYWGSVARDRLRATRLSIGEPAIDFRGKALDGADLTLGGLRGKAVLLVFWSAGDFDLPALVAEVAELQQKHGKALAVVGVNLDPDVAAITAAVRQHGITFPVVGGGKGIQCDAALRWFVEGPTLHVIDRLGRVAALGLHAGTADGKTQLREAVAGAVGAK